MNVVEFRELVFKTYGGVAQTPEVTQLALAMLYQKHRAERDQKAWYVLLAVERNNASVSSFR